MHGMPYLYRSFSAKKSPIFSGSSAEIDLQLQACHGFSPPYSCETDGNSCQVSLCKRGFQKLSCWESLLIVCTLYVRHCKQRVRIWYLAKETYSHMQKRPLCLIIGKRDRFTYTKETCMSDIWRVRGKNLQHDTLAKSLGTKVTYIYVQTRPVYICKTDLYVWYLATAGQELAARHSCPVSWYKRDVFTYAN